MAVSGARETSFRKSIAERLNVQTISQPPLMTPDPEAFQRLPELLALARYPNVAAKISAVPALSRQKYPFADLWPCLHRVVDEFGPDRLM